MIPERLQKFTEPLPVLDNGHVMLVDVMGGEQDIVDAARVSYGKGTKQVSKDRHLIRYLVRHWHTSPLEMCEIKLRVRVPMDTWRQWIRHRTASVNEYSTRYSVAISSKAKTDEEDWRLQSKNNKQGSSGFVSSWPDIPGVDPTADPDREGSWIDNQFYGSPGEYLTAREDELHSLAQEVYDERLKFGVAREQARKDLPLSTYTEAYWKIDLHNLMHFLRLRLDPHAQYEIRMYAEAIAEIVKEWVPNVWEAFVDYRLETMTLSRMEVQGLKALIQHFGLSEEAHKVAVKATGFGKGRERRAFEAKLSELGRNDAES